MKKSSKNRDDIVAVSLEAGVQAAAGMLHFPKGFLKGVRELTDKPQDYGKLIITKELKPPPERIKLCLSPYGRYSSDPVCRHKSTSYLFNLFVKTCPA